MPHALVASPSRWRFAGVCAAATIFLAGCKLWEGAAAEPTAAGRAWLSNLVGQPSDPAPPLDFAWLKPESPTADVLPGDELEVTVHDLFELGKPHTWTSRVTPGGHLDVPLLGRVVVTGADPQQISESLADRYRAGDILLDPRVQVRQLNQATVSVRIDGEVHRAETVPVSRADSNVHRALAAVGGAKSTAGTHVSIKRHRADDASSETKIQSAILSDDLSHEAVWFDIDRDADRQALRNWRLLDGDVITFHPAVAPVRVAGAVAGPGTIKLPAGRQPTVWEIVQLAGGASQPDAACTVTLIRPAKDVHGPQRWSVPVESWADADLGRFPNVEPGDTIHVALTQPKRTPRKSKHAERADDGDASPSDARPHPDPLPEGVGTADNATTEGGS